MEIKYNKTFVKNCKVHTFVLRNRNIISTITQEAFAQHMIRPKSHSRLLNMFNRYRSTKKLCKKIFDIIINESDPYDTKVTVSKTSDIECINEIVTQAVHLTLSVDDITNLPINACLAIWLDCYNSDLNALCIIRLRQPKHASNDEWKNGYMTYVPMFFRIETECCIGDALSPYVEIRLVANPDYENRYGVSIIPFRS